MRADAAQRDYPLREVFHAVRYLVRAGCSWRRLPNDLPPRTAGPQQRMREGPHPAVHAGERRASRLRRR
ncbi:MAG: transposase [Verrucomicrobiota bacterium]